MPSKFESLALVSSPAQTRPRPLCDEDRQQLESALGPDARHPMTIDTKRRMYQEYCRGESVDALAARFHRTRASVYRVIHEMRAERIMALPLDYVPNEHFAHVRSGKARAGDHPSPRRRTSTGRSRGSPAGCRRTWPACTRSRC